VIVRSANELQKLINEIPNAADKTESQKLNVLKKDLTLRMLFQVETEFKNKKKLTKLYL
jgi:hypothetical protein